MVFTPRSVEKMPVRGALDGGPLRRRYSITESGEAYLEFWASSLVWYQEEMDLFFKVYADGKVREASR